MDSPNLSFCGVQSICDWLAAGGEFFIGNNAPGCNSMEELWASCSFCLPEGVTLSTQEQIDNFAVDYPGCSVLSGDVIIEESEAGTITSLAGLSQLITIGGDLRIRSNTALISLKGLENLNYVSGDLRLENNSALLSIDSLHNLNLVNGTLALVANNALSTLAGLESLTAIHGTLMIAVNDGLTTLDGFESLSNIWSGLQVFANNALISLEGLASVKSIGGFLEIIDNPNLSICDIEGVCRFMAFHSSSTITFGRNAPGCNTQTEVLEACLGLVDVKDVQPLEVQIYPTPTSGILQIVGVTDGQISLINQMGAIVMEKTLSGSEVDISALPAGMYFLRIRSRGKSITKRVIRK